jgi:EmrB/QacA subfamily drug resistance transporter
MDLGVESSAGGDERSVRAPALSHRQVLVVFSGLMLGMVLAAIDQTVVATALPTIVGDLGGLEHLSWVVTGYLVAETVSMPIYGKLGDLYGRKRTFQAAIGVFLIGSALSGLASSMPMLVAFRALQGLGGGGLIVTAQATIADVISPRERGRYQGYFGAVFGTATVAGPLLGGFLTQHASWRWVFYINLPLGMAALLVTSVVLPAGYRRTAHRIDWTGAVVLSTAITSFILATTWAGVEYDWGSPVIIGLAAVVVVCGTLFVAIERRADEPMIPLDLFHLRTFNVATTVSLTIGVAMFGVVTYLPAFLQIANGATASNSGLLITPLMLGMIATSIVAGQVVSRTGRYRCFPTCGMALVSIGMFLVSTLDVDSSRLQSGCYMALIGIGIGMTMQILVLATQNEAPARHVGVATSTVTFCRSIGGALGVAAFGTIFATSLTRQIGSLVDINNLSPDAIATLPADQRPRIATAFADAITSGFRYAVPLTIGGFGATLLLRSAPLRRESASARRATEPNRESLAGLDLVHSSTPTTEHRAIIQSQPSR